MQGTERLCRMKSEKHILFENVWREIQSKLTGYFYRQACPEEDVRDLVQETATRAWTNLETCKGDLPAWMFGIARYVFLDYLRRKKDETTIEIDAVDQRFNPEARSIEKLLISQCLQELDPIDRECLVMHDLQGYRFEDIAKKLGISRSNAHYRVEQARQYLRLKYPELVRTFGKKVDE